MSDRQLRLIQRARARFGTIYPCVGKSTWEECFTRDRGQVVFWYNGVDNSTHVETETEK